MRVFQQGTAPAAMFDSNGRKVWEFAYSEEFKGTIHDKIPVRDRMIIKTIDTGIIGMLLQAGAKEILQ